MKTYSLEDVRELFKGEPQKDLWTVVVPAAGKGTRLGYPKAKILYPILGRTILDRLIDLLEPYCSKFVFVLSPAAAIDVLPILNNRLPGRFEAPIIADSRGMADSIYQAISHLFTPYTLIIWGDQVAISSQTIHTVQKLAQSISGAKLTFPLVRRKNPYVHYAVDEEKRLSFVLEKREGKKMPIVGESDCGVFACNTQRLQEIYKQEIEKGITLSQATKEWNFLPMLPSFEIGGDSVNAYRLESIEEAIGVNDTDDVAALEKYFNKL